ncbi:MAG: class I tRNA ligase family protein [Candidatus Freyarchaeota archaeon]
MNFDVKEMNKRPYQVLSTLYHLHRFFIQNAEYDGFNPQRNTLSWAEENNALRDVDRWLLSKLQQAIEEVTERNERCEFHFALSRLEDFVVNVISRQYVPAIRRELWSDDPQTLNRRLAIYATLWHVLKTITLLFNPVTPYLSEAMYQRVYRELDPTLPESVNFENWPKPNEAFRDASLEREFDVMFRCISLVYSARQSARLKRRWPLRKAIVVAPKPIQRALSRLEDVFLELANVKEVEFVEGLPEVDLTRWALASEDELRVLVDTYRDDALRGEGLMRDLARRIQALRKELGFVPTEVLEAAYLAELDSESERLLKPHLAEMAELVRAKEVRVCRQRTEIEVKWYERKLDDKKVYIAIS